jgi:hypothetical protein
MAWTWDRFEDRGTVFDELFGHRADVRAGSAGLSFFIGGGFYPALRWDYAWRTDDFQHYTKRPRAQFRMAYNF